MSLSPPPGDAFLPFTNRLNQLGARYMVSGSVAAMLYGEPRFTNDIDLIINLDISTAKRLPEFFPLSEFYCPPHEVILAELTREVRGHFNLMDMDTGFKADVYVQKNDPLHAWAFERVRQLTVDGSTLSVAPMEYVIIRKLEYFREGGSEKHLRDIASMLRISGNQLRVDEFNELLAERGLQPEWEKVRR